MSFLGDPIGDFFRNWGLDLVIAFAGFLFCCAMTYVLGNNVLLAGIIYWVLMTLYLLNRHRPR